ncbi:hypothetical protein [Aureliella helgolandensis]|uniref:Uncharacterized protein n=1 Tax=Aureliella helgolandensis TaxID=2527968 RepID=A0A518GBI6_9BACT|nr:hypothetical protein [Aureliella helgolandensis]QDV25923.1 hypothetical protein Q31a_42910 [Aureliella helgolandensis]
MNLGDIYFKTFLVLLAAPVITTLVLLGVLRQRLKLTWGNVCLVAFFIAPFAGILLNGAFHHRVFAAWHQAQNRFVPRSGCVTYSPDFARLYATYRMTLPQFNAWATTHPWGLTPGSSDLLTHDEEAMGFDSPIAAFETSMADNGKQLRVYFKSGVMYLSYNSM